MEIGVLANTSCAILHLTTLVVVGYIHIRKPRCQQRLPLVNDRCKLVDCMYPTTQVLVGQLNGMYAISVLMTFVHRYHESIDGTVDVN